MILLQRFETDTDDLSHRSLFLAVRVYEVLLVSVTEVDGFLPSVPYIVLEDEDDVKENREEPQTKLGRISEEGTPIICRKLMIK